MKTTACFCLLFSFALGLLDTGSPATPTPSTPAPTPTTATPTTATPTTATPTTATPTTATPTTATPTTATPTTSVPQTAAPPVVTVDSDLARTVVATMLMSGVAGGTGTALTSFGSFMEDFFLSALTATTTKVESLVLGTDVVVALTAWFGSSDGESKAATVRSLVTSDWSVLKSNVTMALNTAAANLLGGLPAQISYSSQCSYNDVSPPAGWVTPAPSVAATVTCDTGFTAALVYTNGQPTAESMRSIFQTILAGIPVSSISATVGSGSASVVVLTSHAVAAIGQIVASVTQASELATLGIHTITINGFLVYTEGELSAGSYSGTFQECTTRLWWLLFLILFAPLCYVVMSTCYRRGKERGKRVAREQEEDAKEKAKTILSHHAQGLNLQQVNFLQQFNPRQYEEMAQMQQQMQRLPQPQR